MIEPNPATYDGLPTLAQDLRMHRWYNDDRSTCPAFGYIQLPPFSQDGPNPDNRISTVFKKIPGPDGTFEKVIKGRSRNEYGLNHRKLRLFAINGPTPVGPGAVGQCHQSYPCYVTYVNRQGVSAFPRTDEWRFTDDWNSTYLTNTGASITPVGLRANLRIDVNANDSFGGFFCGRRSPLTTYEYDPADSLQGKFYPFADAPDDGNWDHIGPLVAGAESFAQGHRNHRNAADDNAISTSIGHLPSTKPNIPGYEKSGDIVPWNYYDQHIVCQSEGLWRGSFSIFSSTSGVATESSTLTIAIMWSSTVGSDPVETLFRTSCQLTDDRYSGDGNSIRAGQWFHVIPFALYMTHGSVLSLRYTREARLVAFGSLAQMTAVREAPMPIVWSAL